jgi:hypothetical protein
VPGTAGGGFAVTVRFHLYARISGPTLVRRPCPRQFVADYGTYTEHFCGQVLPPIGPSVQGAVQVTWSGQVGIVSSTTFTPTAGFPFSQTIYATGTPAPALKLTYGNLSDQFKIFTFTDNGDGSATISAPASAMKLATTSTNSPAQSR